MRWVVNLLACICGLLVGALMWNSYRLVTEGERQIPTIQATQEASDFSNPGWGSWLDLPASTPPAKLNAENKQNEKSAQNKITTTLYLIGIIGFGSDGVAIMRVENGQEKVYREGDVVLGEVILKKVGENGLSITLSNGKTTKVYRLPEAKGLVTIYSDVNQANLPQKVLPIQPLASDTNKQSSSNKKRAADEAAKQESYVRLIEPKTKQKLKDLRQDPYQAAQAADTEFIRRDGSLYGVRIGDLHNPALFQAVGLNRNDIVLSVNGVTVAELASDPVRGQAMLSERSYRINIIRNGANKVVYFSWPE